MFCFKDRTYCCSLNCENKCGRKMSDEEKQQLKKLNEEWKKTEPDFGFPVAYAYFCGETDEKL